MPVRGPMEAPDGTLVEKGARKMPVRDPMKAPTGPFRGLQKGLSRDPTGPSKGHN